MPGDLIPAADLLTDSSKLSLYSMNYQQSYRGVDQALADLTFVLGRERDPNILLDLASKRIELGQKQRRMYDLNLMVFDGIGGVRPPDDQDLQQSRQLAQKIANQTADAQSINDTIEFASALAQTFIDLHA